MVFYSRVQRLKKNSGDLIKARIYADDTAVGDIDDSVAALCPGREDTSSNADGTAPFLFAQCLVF